MKNLILILILMSAFLPSVLAFSTLNPSSLYVDLNTSYPIVVSSTNSTLDVYIFTNGTSFPLNWTGTQYEINLLFDTTGNYPFVINSTNTSGQTTGTFIVRTPYYVNFSLFKTPSSWCWWCSDVYDNDYAYVTAEFTERPANSPYNHYNPTLEKYVTPLAEIPNAFKKPVFYAEYINGIANLKLYEEESYAFRMIDGQMTFPSQYGYVNISEPYGTNIYLGKYAINQSGREFQMLIDDSDLHPYTSLLNWIYIILLIVCVVGSIFIFFITPQYPAISMTFGLGGAVLLTILRIALWIGGY